MVNIREEYFKFVGNRKVKAVEIKHNCDYTGEETFMDLQVGYTPRDLQIFFGKMDFSYSSGYGASTRLEGTIWFEDGSWGERWEYDGSEGWLHKWKPQISHRLYNPKKY